MPSGMFAALLRVVVVLALLGVLDAQEAPQMTADEHMMRADAAYNARQHAEAAALYRKFFDDYAKAQEPQIQDIIRRRRYELAMCHVHLKDFTKAQQAIEEAMAAVPPLDRWQLQELAFWLGVSLLQQKDYAAAVAQLDKFLGMFAPGSERRPDLLKQFPAMRQIPEARLLRGTALLLDEKYGEAAAYLGGLLPQLPPEERSRAVVLRLYALLGAEDDEAALALVKEEFPRMGEITQLAAFQALALQAGGRLLEAGRLRDAIACLQRVWPRERTLKHQRTKLGDLEARLAAAEANPNADPYLKLSLAQQIAKVRREVGTFEKIEDFDSALRLRLATAYQRMERYRESGLIMEAMLEELPPDKLVEQASVNLVQTWNRVERWPKVVEAAGNFEAAFPQSESLPVVLYLRGIAEQRTLDYQAAVATFARLAREHPKSEFAPRAMFLEAFTQLLAEHNAQAVDGFDKFLKTHAGHELADAAEYWRGMGFSLDKRFAEAREAMQAYIEKRKDGAFRSSAFFRKAYCAQQLEDFTTSIRELEDYLRRHPGGEEVAEARVLLGDALMNEGRIEEGIEVFAAIPRDETRFYEEGVFKTGRALKLLEEYDRLRLQMEAFVEASPASPRVAEAIYNIGWVHRQAGDIDKARTIYWDAIRQHGDDPAIRSVDDLFPALARLYKGDDERARYLARLRDLREEADAGAKKTLAMRALWAQGDVLRKADPERASALFAEASTRASVQTTNPMLLADFAEAQPDGEALWRDLIKWNPRAPQKDRALAALGFLELSRGNEKAALAMFDRFEREVSGSLLLGRVMLARAGLLAGRGERDGARRSLELLLGSPSASGPEKCEALYRMGELHLRDGKPALAVPYFQRIYVMHGKWRDWVARAYYRSGEAFEELGDKTSARRTYQELAARDDLAAFEETAKARARLDALGGPAAPSG